jgi:Dolichyl-phosphate-mannose-protein mannosyltransferase
MRSDLTTDSPNRQNTKQAGDSQQPPVSWRSWRLGGLSFSEVVKLLGAIALGALLLALVYQIPATHTVDIGGYDAAYVQGFYDSERGGAPILAGSDGSARWTHDVSYLLFPQAGLPAQVTLRLRGRPIGPPAELVVLLNTGPSQDQGGARELGRVHPGAAWENYTFTIDAGLLKPNDVVIELRTSAAPSSTEDPRAVGVLLDRAIYRTSALPIVPYPAQLIYGALAAGMLYLLVRRPTTNPSPLLKAGDRPMAAATTAVTTATAAVESSYIFRRPWFIIGLAVLLAAFLFLYRLQPPYPYPLRLLLPAIDLALAAVLALRYGSAAARRAPTLFDGLALGGIGAWTLAILLAARNHVTLSIPGVENDFGAFARRSAQLAGHMAPGGAYDPATDGVLRADGFYNLGYPLLLWLVRPLTNDNPFLAARLIAALSGALLLGATWWLARRLLGRGPALLALLALALSPFAVEYGLYLGSDMPFAALCTLALALILTPRTENGHPQGQPRTRSTQAEQRTKLVLPLDKLRNRGAEGNKEQKLARHTALVVLAGLVAGAAFLMRHPGLLLLPFGWLALWRSYELQALSFEFYSQRVLLKTQNQALEPFVPQGKLREGSKLKTRSLLLFTLAFLIAIAPQLFVNIRDTGQPFYSQQAKNIWLCVYGSCDWGRWDEAPNNVTLSDVVLRDPGRFLASWWANIRGFFGTGGEDTTEFGRAIQLRLLSFPANWLALGGLLAWVVAAFRKHAAPQPHNYAEHINEAVSAAHPFRLLLVWIALYVLAVSVGIALPRFFLPLAPVYALAAAWTITRIEPRTPSIWLRADENREPNGTNTEYRIQNSEQTAIQQVSGFRFYILRFTFYVLRNIQLIAAMLLLMWLWSGFAAGVGYVLGNQQPDEAAAVRLVQATLRPGERVVVRVPPRVAIDTSSAIAHLVVPENGQYLLTSADSPPSSGARVGTAGQYTLYRIAP